ncbi:unnamed protein product [Larinioides sclopetarius]|uniref:Uncharacterized protein n=1 Tax=Larinioides sclopetarius TaxID=280406 RepID=A0AAV2ARA1_9ARAC
MTRDYKELVSIKLALTPQLKPRMLYGMSTCCLVLQDHQIFLQSSTYGTSFDDIDGVTHNQH